MADTAVNAGGIVAQQQAPGSLCRDGAAAKEALKTALAAGLSISNYRSRVAMPEPSKAPGFESA